MKLLGIDRCRNGWLVAESDERLRNIEYRVEESLGELLGGLDENNARVIVDVPIGIPVSTSRAVDFAARKVLGPGRTSSVFPVPMRAALTGQTYEEASALNFAACGRKLPVQAFGILDGIRELDRFMTPARQEWVREGHPEVTFAMLAREGRGVVLRKKSQEGEAVRLTLLEPLMPAPDIDRLRGELGRARVGRDDLVDALAMLASAHRWHTGRARVLPDDGVEMDTRGLRMEMVA